MEEIKSVGVEKLTVFLPVKSDCFTGAGSPNLIEVLERVLQRRQL